MSCLQTGQIIVAFLSSSNYTKLTRPAQYSGFIGRLETSLFNFAFPGNGAVMTIAFGIVTQERAKAPGKEIENVSIEADVFHRPGDYLRHLPPSFSSLFFPEQEGQPPILEK
jgi:hypothetical protein